MLNTVFFSVLAVVRRRKWQWIVWPAVLGPLYFLGVYCLLTRGGWWATHIYDEMGYFRDWGRTPVEVVSNMLTHPARIADAVLDAGRLGYLLYVLTPLLVVLPFGNWAWVLAVPNLAVNLLASDVTLRLRNTWYNILLGGQLCASMVVALPLWNRLLERFFGRRDFSRWICLAVLLLAGSQFRYWFNPAHYKRLSTDATRREAVKFIPRNATVFCPRNYLHHFTDRRNIACWETTIRVSKRRPSSAFDFDYILIDAIYVGDNPDLQQRVYDLVKTDQAYRTVFAKDGIFVFRRVGTSSSAWPE